MPPRRIPKKLRRRHCCHFIVDVSMATQNVSDVPGGGSDPPTGMTARVKKFHSKSRKGCLTCRARRVKCDERREPMCARCERGGYVCEWQNSPPKMLSPSDNSTIVRRRLSPSRSTSSNIEQDITPPESVYQDYDNRTKRIVIMFYEMIQSFLLEQSSSTFTPHQLSDLYYNIVQQASYTSMVIQKTLTALSTLQDWIEYGMNAPSQNHLFIKYYSESVTDLRQMSGELAPESILITCMLFATCEFLMGYLTTGAQHLRAGARILAEQKRSAASTLPPHIVEVLEPIFNAFDRSSASLPEYRVETHDESSTMAAGNECFTSLASANDALRQLCFNVSLLMCVAKAQPAQVIPAAIYLKNNATLWLHQCDSLRRLVTPTDSPWLQLLLAHYQMMDTILHIQQSSEYQLLRDSDTFESLILRMETFLEAESDLRTSSGASNNPFETHLGYIAPLFFVTLHCNDFTICHRALRLLCRTRVQEGYWNSCVAYAIALFVVDTRKKCLKEMQLKSPTAEENLPAIEIRSIAHTDNGTKIRIQLEVRPHGVGTHEVKFFSDTLESFCACQPDERWTLERIVKASGCHGFVKPIELAGCNCHMDED